MAFDLEELEPRKKPLKPKDLTTFSIEDLRAYITALETEIGRARATIQAKEAVRSGADALFRR